MESDDFRLYCDIIFMECLGKTLLSSTQFPLGVCPMPGAAASPSALGLLPGPASAAPRLHSRDRDWGMWHTPQLSQDQMDCLSACKESKKNKCIYFTAVYTAEPLMMVSGTGTAASHCCNPEPQCAQTDPEAPPHQAAGDEWGMAVLGWLYVPKPGQ